MDQIISGKLSHEQDLGEEILNDPAFDSAEFEVLEKIWNGADLLKDYQEASLSDGWEKIARETGIEAPVRKINFLREWAVAASVIGLLCLGLYLYLDSIPYTYYRTSAEVQYSLPDNSVVTLQPGAEIRHLKTDRFDVADRREVHLKGEGEFDVVVDEKPFLVVTELTSVDVLGTVFKYKAEGVYSESENISGLVKFATNDGVHEQTLKPGDKAVFDGNEMTYFEAAPPPPPPPTPENNLTAGDLLDILQEVYMLEIEWGPNIKYSNTVVNANLSDLSKSNLENILVALDENENINIEYVDHGSYYKVSKFSGVSSGLTTVDYSYDMFARGIAPNK